MVRWLDDDRFELSHLALDSYSVFYPMKMKWNEMKRNEMNKIVCSVLMKSHRWRYLSHEIFSAFSNFAIGFARSHRLLYSQSAYQWRVVVAYTCKKGSQCPRRLTRRRTTIIFSHEASTAAIVNDRFANIDKLTVPIGGNRELAFE